MMRMMYLIFFISSLTELIFSGFFSGYNLIYDLENGFDCFYSYNVFISTLIFLYILSFSSESDKESLF